jgi:hypothetical protein
MMILISGISKLSNASLALRCADLAYFDQDGCLHKGSLNSVYVTPLLSLRMSL